MIPFTINTDIKNILSKNLSILQKGLNYTVFILLVNRKYCSENGIIR